MKYRGKAKKFFKKLERLCKDDKMSFDEKIDKKADYIHENIYDLNVEIPAEKNQGEGILICIDVDGNLRIASKKHLNIAPRITHYAIKVLYNFIRENYDID